MQRSSIGRLCHRLACVEELVWNHTLGQSRGWLFGDSPGVAESLSGLREVLVPLLAVARLTHYVLDGFIWKRRSNPDFRLVEESAANRLSGSGGAGVPRADRTCRASGLRLVAA